MFDYEYLFAMNLQQKLKTKIKGKIYVKITMNDELFVKIEREDEELEYKLFLGHFSERIRNGWSTDYATYEVLRLYKKFIFDRMEEMYFYTN